MEQVGTVTDQVTTVVTARRDLLSIHFFASIFGLSALTPSLVLKTSALQ